MKVLPGKLSIMGFCRKSSTCHRITLEILLSYIKEASYLPGYNFSQFVQQLMATRSAPPVTDQLHAMRVVEED